MAALLTQQDTLGQRPKDVTSGSHPTYSGHDGMPLFFKATAFGKEDSLGTTKEQAMYLLATKLFRRGIAKTSLITIARQTTIEPGLSKFENQDLHDEVFRPDPERFLNPNVFDETPGASREAVERMQRMHNRVLQVAEKVTGPMLEDALGDPSQLDPQSLSETVVLTLLTTADDAKGDNFIVNRSGEIIGIDNDHVFSDTLIPLPVPDDAPAQQYKVHFKNILLCSQTILDMPVHPNVTEQLLTSNTAQLLVEWLGELARYELRVEEMYADGAVPAIEMPDGSRWVSTDTGADLDLGIQTDLVAARIYKLWGRMQGLLSSKKSCTHRELFQYVLPETARFYQEIREHTLRADADVDPDELALINKEVYHIRNTAECDRPPTPDKKVLKWLYYQSAEVPIRVQIALPPLVLKIHITSDVDGYEVPLSPPKAGTVVLLTAGSIDTYSQQAYRLLAELDVDAIAAENVLQLAQSASKGFPKTFLSIVLAARMQLKLSHKLLMAGVTDARLLELITWVAQNDAPAKPSSTMVQVAVQSAIDRAVQGGANSSSQTPVVELKVQLQHLLAAGVPIDPTTDTTAPRPVPLLGTIARAYVTSVRVGKISLLHSLFLLLIELGAENLGSISTMVQYWSLLLDEAKVAANNGDQLASTDVPNALDVFAKTNRRLAWEMSLDQLLVASDPTQSILQIADMGLYKISTGSSFEELIVDGEFQRRNVTGRSSVGRISAGNAGSDVYFKCRPELPG